MKARRITALILSLMLLIGMFQVAASAATPTVFGMINEYEYAGSDDDVNKAFVTDHQAAIEAVFAGCLNHEASINIYDLRVPVNDYYGLVPAVLGIYPELFFVDNLGGTTQNGYIKTITPTYSVATKAKSDAMLEEFYNKADEYLALLDDGMDDFTKAIVLHDALVLNNRYQLGDDPDDLDPAPEDITSTNYTFMVEGWGRCENYAECYAYLLAQVGIKSEIINSYEVMNHEWMKIQLDGSEYYYNVDITWDDPIGYYTNKDIPDKVRHDYFLLSDDAVNFSDHTGYETINETADTYDEHDNLHSAYNPFFYVNNALYTLHRSGSYGCIATYDPASDTFTDVYTVTDRWSAGGYSYWGNNFSGFGMDSGLFYYNGDNCVYCFDPVTAESSLYIENAPIKEGMHLYGLYVKDGYIYGRVGKSPNESTDNIHTYVLLGETIHSHAVDTADGILNGTVTADKTAARTGETVTLTIKADKGYTVDTVYCNNTPIEPENGVYSFEMPDEDVLITAQFKTAPVLAGHSISLNGEIGLNFYYNLTEAQATGRSVSFTWTVEGNPKEAVCALSEDEKTGLYKASCPIAVAEMTYEVTATLTVGDETYSDAFSAAQYADYILTNASFASSYIASENKKGNNGEERLEKLQTLVKSMLDFGAKAQTQFSRNTDDLANKNLTSEDQTSAYFYDPGTVTADMITTGASDMTEGLSAYGLTYAGSTIVYLSKTAIRHYYVISGPDDFADYSDSVTFGSDTPIEYETKGAQIFYEMKNVAAADLDTLYTITIGGAAYKYSALDYVKLCLTSSKTSGNMRALACATYLYNQAADAYFTNTNT